MRTGGGHAKGASWERALCVKLSLWITGGVKQDCLWRSAMSGGRATVARKRGKLVRQAGDITAVSPEGHLLTDLYYIEAKHYGELAINSFFLGGKGTLWRFWLDTVEQAGHYERIPLLIARQNRLPTLALTELDGMTACVGIDVGVPLWRSKQIGCDVWLLDTLLDTPCMLRFV